MKIPKSVRIGSVDYKVNRTELNLVANGREASATIDYGNHLIEINTTYGDEQWNEVSFLHELMHGMIHETDIKLDNEEDIAEKMARSLHQVIKDNPNIFK